MPALHSLILTEIPANPEYVVHSQQILIWHMTNKIAFYCDIKAKNVFTYLFFMWYLQFVTFAGMDVRRVSRDKNSLDTEDARCIERTARARYNFSFQSLQISSLIAYKRKISYSRTRDIARFSLFKLAFFKFYSRL